MEQLALLGGTPVIKEAAPEELFKWPIMTEEDYDAAMDVVVNNKFSNTDITIKFQEEFAAWQGRKYALAFTNGTMSLTAAMFAIGLSEGDEIICPTKTYWGSVSQAAWFGAKAVFCNINDMLSMDPADLERCITPKTKAIVVVHYFGYPCDMDAIMEIANKHGLYVIEDVSHAHGTLYKGKKVGCFGHIAAMSMMSWKLFAAGEMGMLVTDDRNLYERAIAFGHYERNNEKFIEECEDLKDYYHIALGGVKGRVNQVCSALARVQLKYFDERCARIREAMNYFYDQLERLPGLSPLRVDTADGSMMGGFYSPHIAYHPEQLGGLSATRFAEAVTAEFNGAFKCRAGGNFCLHTHRYFKTFDPMHPGVPKQDDGKEETALNVSEQRFCISAPWFKHYDKAWIDLYVQAFRKVTENYAQLLEGDTNQAQGGIWYGAEADRKAPKKS
ncbi:MAG: aminotransferase class I/II-fold pyridoxal phosphate-dependent enzyme [Clostridia bacterium]|nr:aminotransferase class I/II-fold pyridoxal phosphate-dependent enzyme [Clostridia bacterium]